MTDTYVRLSNSLHRTRDSLVDVCYVLGINPESVKLEELGVFQCADCSVWETPNNIVEDVCVFCYAMDTLRF
jgi:hypothetical protein